MSPTPTAVAHQEARAKVAAATAKAAGTTWRRVDAEDIEESWQEQLGELLVLVAGGQLAAAQSTEPWLEQLLGEDEDQVQGDQLDPAALMGLAPDGRSLAELLMYPVWHALHAIARGVSVALALARGRALLDLLVRTVIADTGRAADLVGMIARPAVTSYIRVVELPACPRCIVLAGVEYGISSGFQRHPRCDCTMEPVTRAHTPTPSNAKTLYGQMSPAQQRKAFGAAAVKAIADGADIEQLVNARRGMTTATYYGRRVSVTTEGTTRRGIAGSRRRKHQKIAGNRYATAKAPRLMPEEIYRIADDRQHAIRLLRRNGFLI